MSFNMKNTTRQILKKKFHKEPDFDVKYYNVSDFKRKIFLHFQS